MKTSSLQGYQIPRSAIGKPLDLETILKLKKKWDQKSKSYEKKYNKTDDPAILKEWFSVTAFATSAQWFNDAITRLRMNDQEDIISEIFTLADKGKRKNQVERWKKNMLLMFKIDRLVSEGMTRTAAFQKVTGDYFKTGENRGYDAIKNAYYASKKHEPEIHVEETDTEFQITAFPAVVSYAGTPMVGTWTIKIPKPSLIK
jgi:hypothetical protein